MRLNKKSQASNIVPSELVGLILSGLALLIIIGMIVMVWGFFINDHDNTIENFDKLTAVVAHQLQNSAIFSYNEEMLHLGNKYFIVGFDSSYKSDWEGYNKKIDTCRDKHIEKPAILCGRKACLCLYKENDYSKPVKCKTFDGNEIYFYGSSYREEVPIDEPDVVYMDTEVYDYNSGLPKTSHYDIDLGEAYEFLVIHGTKKCIVENNFETQLMYIESYKNKDGAINILIARRSDVPKNRTEKMIELIKNKKKNELDRIADLIANVNDNITITPEWSFSRAEIEEAVLKQKLGISIGWKVPLLRAHKKYDVTLQEYQIIISES